MQKHFDTIYSSDIRLGERTSIRQFKKFEDGMKNMISLNLVSEEFIRNEAGTSRLIHRYDGKISDHVESIIKSGERSLKTSLSKDTFVPCISISLPKNSINSG